MHMQSPRWWQLYGLGALMLGALVWAHRLGLSAQAEMVLQVFILAVTFGLIFVWLGANGPALLNDGAASMPYADPVRLDRPAEAPELSSRPDPETVVERGNGAEPTGVGAPTYPDRRPVIAGSVLD